jgi:hypothetical protein
MASSESGPLCRESTLPFAEWTTRSSPKLQIQCRISRAMRLQKTWQLSTHWLYHVVYSMCILLHLVHLIQPMHKLFWFAQSVTKSLSTNIEWTHQQKHTVTFFFPLDFMSLSTSGILFSFVNLSFIHRIASGWRYNFFVTHNKQENNF